MKLYIKNIAKIEECCIEFNGITVIAGENSTGKSTVSKTLYSIFDSLYDYEDKIRQSLYSSINNYLLSLVGFDYVLSTKKENIKKLIDLRNDVVNYETVKNVIDDAIDEHIESLIKDSDFDNKKKKFIMLFLNF